VRLSPVNGGPPWIAGVFVYRGRVVPVVDLHRLIGAGDCPPHLSSRIILLPYPRNAPDSLVGLLATQVAEIREVQTPQLEGDRPDQTGLGPALPDGSGILHVLHPDSLLGQIAAGSAGLIDAGVRA
jgi:chemotaxis-related protein WspB